MNPRFHAIFVLLIAVAMIYVPSRSDARSTYAQSRSEQTLVSPTTFDEARVATALQSSPVMFIENVGQFDAGARFQVRGVNSTVYLTNDAIWYSVRERTLTGDASFGFTGSIDRALAAKEPQSSKAANLKLSFVGANPNPVIETFDRLDTRISYFIGNDPESWRADVPVWGGISYIDLYPGIDLEMKNDGGRIMQRLVSRPAADPGAVRLRVEGAESVSLSGDQLAIMTTAGEFELPLFPLLAKAGVDLAPGGNEETLAHLLPFVSMDERSGEGVWEIVAPFAIGAGGASGKPSPVGVSTASDLTYATFLGGLNDDWGYGIAVDNAGNAYVTGVTNSSVFSAAALGPGLDPTYNAYHGGYDAFVVMINSGGTAPNYITFVGGSNVDSGRSIAVEDSGLAYVTGQTNSADFIAGAFGPLHGTTINAYHGGYDAFVVKLNASGAVIFATLIGGSNDDFGHGIAVDKLGGTYVTGYTSSTNFGSAGYDPTYNGGQYDAFAVRLYANGTVVYSTFLGGSGSDYAYGVAVDDSGNAYVTGVTDSPDFPATLGPGYDTTYNDGGGDAFVVKLNSSGDSLSYATFLGGSGVEYGRGIVVESSGKAYVTGVTTSSDFPAALGPGFDTTLGDGGDAFVVKLNESGSSLLYATFVGSNGWDDGYGIAIDGSGNAYVAGVTNSPSLPTALGSGYDTTYNGGSYDAFAVKLNANGTALPYATFLGGSSNDYGNGIAVDGSGNAYVIGFTHSTDFPAAIGPGYDPTYNGGEYDAFVTKLAIKGIFVKNPGIEVNQAIQDLDNKVTLIAGKRTFVRCYAQSNVGDVDFVPARLKVYRGPDLMGTLAPANPGATATVRTSPDRSTLNDSHYFDVPTGWLSAGSVTFECEVNYDPGTHAEYGNSVRSTTVSFVNSPTMKLKIWDVDYLFGGVTLTVRALDRDFLASWLRRAYPIEKLDVEWATFDPPYSVIPTADQVNGDLTWNKVKSTTANGEDPWMRYYGMAIDTGGFMRGKAVDIPSVVASGPTGPPPDLAFWDQDGSWGDWYGGHELGHTYGRSHVDCGNPAGPDPNYPYPNGDISPNQTAWSTTALFGLDALGPMVIPPSWKDVMTYCDSEWLSDYTYEGIYNQMIAEKPVSKAAMKARIATSGIEHLVVLGSIITPTDQITLSTFYRLPNSVDMFDRDLGGAYEIRFLGAADAPLANYPFSPHFNPASEEPIGAITEMVPWVSGTEKIVILHGATWLITRTVSANNPTVAITYPNGGETLSGNSVTVTWTGNDLDLDPLSYSLDYSRDGGTTWEPRSAGIATTQATLNLNLLPGATQGLFRVWASDGVNSASDDSNGTFTVASKLPSITAIRPVSGAEYIVGQTVTLEGSAFDAEDGLLPDARMQWSSNIAGAIGTGNTRQTIDLPAGVHTITLTATDSDNNQTTAATNITVTSVLTTVLASFSGTPVSGTAPLTVTFSNGSTGDFSNSSWTFGDGATSESRSPTHTYATGGVYTVNLSVSGSGGTDTITRTNYITVIDPLVQAYISAVAIAGPATGSIQTNYAFTATVSPFTATLPITYAWEVTGLAPVIFTNVADVSNSTSFALPFSGPQTITVTASNAGGVVTATHSITMNVPPNNLTIDGPSISVIQASYSFTATVSPITATMPITYVWQATDQTTITNTGSLGDAATYAWNTPGAKAITVTASNEAGTITSTRATMVWAKVFLPLVLRSYAGSW